MLLLPFVQLQIVGAGRIKSNHLSLKRNRRSGIELALQVLIIDSKALSKEGVIVHISLPDFITNVILLSLSKRSNTSGNLEVGSSILSPVENLVRGVSS